MIKSKKLKSNIIVVLFTLIVALVSAAIVGRQYCFFLISIIISSFYVKL